VFKNIKPVVVALVFLFVLTGSLLAQENQPGQLNPSKASLYKIALIVGGAVIALAAMAGAYCQSRAISAACEGISRNPGAAPHIRFLLIFGLVLIETLVIYSLLISIIILMIQWGKYV
jgi:F-type H+-transporting ATPase subunit c